MNSIGWITTSNKDHAEDLAREWVEKKFVHCAQIEGPIQSICLREGQLEEHQQYRLTVGFSSENLAALEARLQDDIRFAHGQWLTFAADPREIAAPGREQENVSVSDKGAAWIRENAIELFKAGTQLLKNKKYGEAEKILLQAYELDSRNTYILVGLGDLHREQRKFKKAIDYYEQALAVDERNVFALRGIGDACRGLNDHRQAIVYWKRYLECNRDDVQVMTRVGDSYKKLEQIEDSENYYLQALELDPTDSYGLLGLGNLYYKAERDAEALIYLEKLLALDEGYVAALTMVGNIYRRRKEYEKAIKYYLKAVEREPGNTFALYGLGDCYRWLQNYQEVVAWWTRILDKEPENQVIHSRVGDAFLNIGDREKASKHYQKSLRIRFDPYALLGLSKIYRDEKQFEKAITCCREILCQMPRNNRAQGELLEIYKELGEPEKAREIISEISS